MGDNSVFGYARVSTVGQVVDRQIDALHDAGIPDERIFTDHLSGTTTSRPQLDRLMDQLRPGDTLVIHALDRLGRDTRQLLAWVDELRERKVALLIIQLGVDTSTPAGRMVMTVIAALAAMEREVLVERVKGGLAAARVRRRVGGRPAALTQAQCTEAERMLMTGRPSGEIAALFSCSARTIRRTSEATRHVS